MAWKLSQYEDVLSSFLLSCRTTPELDADVNAHLRALQEKGNQLGMPMSEFLEDGIFQLRPHGDNVQARLLYYFGKYEKKAVFVVCFPKTTRTTPREFIDQAKRRRAELEKQEEAQRRQAKRGKSNGNRTYH